MASILQEHAEVYASLNKWERITAKQASVRHRFTVPYTTHLFRCPICHQYLTFSNSVNGLQRPHFRHERGGEDCKYKLNGLTPPSPQNEVFIYKRLLKKDEYPILLDFEAGDIKLKLFSSFYNEPFPISVRTAIFPDNNLRLFLQYPNNITKEEQPNIKTINRKKILGVSDLIRKSGAIFFENRRKIKYNRAPLIGSSYYFLIPVAESKNKVFDGISPILKSSNWCLFRVKISGTEQQDLFIVKLGYDYPTIFYDMEPIWPPAHQNSRQSDNRVEFIHSTNRITIAELNEPTHPFLEIEQSDIDLFDAYIAPENIINTFSNSRPLAKTTVKPLLVQAEEQQEFFVISISPEFDGHYEIYNSTDDSRVGHCYRKQVFSGGDPLNISLNKSSISSNKIKLLVFYGLDCVLTKDFIVEHLEKKTENKTIVSTEPEYSPHEDSKDNDESKRKEENNSLVASENVKRPVLRLKKTKKSEDASSSNENSYQKVSKVIIIKKETQKEQKNTKKDSKKEEISPSPVNDIFNNVLKPELLQYKFNLNDLMLGNTGRLICISLFNYQTQCYYLQPVADIKLKFIKQLVNEIDTRILAQQQNLLPHLVSDRKLPQLAVFDFYIQRNLGENVKNRIEISYNEYAVFSENRQIHLYRIVKKELSDLESVKAEIKQSFSSSEDPVTEYFVYSPKNFGQNFNAVLVDRKDLEQGKMDVGCYMLDEKDFINFLIDAKEVCIYSKISLPRKIETITI